MTCRPVCPTLVPVYEDYPWIEGQEDPAFWKRYGRIYGIVHELTGFQVVPRILAKSLHVHRPKNGEIARFAFYYAAETTLPELGRTTTWDRFRGVPFAYLSDVFLGRGSSTFYESAYSLARAAHGRQVPASWVRQFLSENHDWLFYEYDPLVIPFIANAAVWASPDDVRRVENDVCAWRIFTYREVLKLLSEGVTVDYLCELAKRYEFRSMPFSAQEVAEGYRSGIPVEYMMALECDDGTA